MMELVAAPKCLLLSPPLYQRADDHLFPHAKVCESGSPKLISSFSDMCSLHCIACYACQRDFMSSRSRLVRADIFRDDPCVSTCKIWRKSVFLEQCTTNCTITLKNVKSLRVRRLGLFLCDFECTRHCVSLKDHVDGDIDSKFIMNYGGNFVNQGGTNRKRHGDFRVSEAAKMDPSSWNLLIKEYTKKGLHEDGIRVFMEMMDLGVLPDKYTLPCVIQAFTCCQNLRLGRQIHGYVLKMGAGSDIFVNNSLLAMYCKCSSMKNASNVFKGMPKRDVVSFNTLIAGFDESGKPLEALGMLNVMYLGGVKPNLLTCLAALSACASYKLLIHGREIHAFALRNGFVNNEFLTSATIHMYMKCGNWCTAERVFCADSLKNVVSYNIMMSGYVDNRCAMKAMMLFFEMLMHGIEPDSATMVALVASCSELLDLELGRQIHSQVVKHGMHTLKEIETSLIDMYCKCGKAEIGLHLFEKSPNKNLVMWGCIIEGCAQSGQGYKSLDLLRKLHLSGGRADLLAILSGLRVCSSLKHRYFGIELHGFSIKMAYESDVFIGGALTDMYSKCGDIDAARKVFLRLPMKDVISWNAIIAGSLQNGDAELALKCFWDMQAENVSANSVTIACVLAACSHLSLLFYCQQIHGYVLRNGLDSNVLVCNSLISSFARCGGIQHAWAVFRNMPSKDDTSWNSMLLGFGMHGLTDRSLDLFRKMKESGVKPNHTTFAAILSSCSHAGRVEEGWKHFESMKDYGLTPMVEHYTCMVDLLGRAGWLKQAVDLIRQMPSEPDPVVWGSLLGSCKVHRDDNLANYVANRLFELDSENVGYHVLLSNIYADFGRWEAVNSIRAHAKEVGLKKKPGCSWIEVGNEVHVFTAKDRSHCQLEEIYSVINSLTENMKSVGYLPQMQ
ncbi:Pentatricopeptide repeat-containing protein [Nymphaea thermarum]|nr:Pentatricopeptide repeat-containing protein [Nymphaea thermarum]